MKRLLFVVISLILLAFLVLAGVLVVNSQVDTPPFVGAEGNSAPNSIAEIRDIEINGLSQRVLIRGENRDNPLLLHLHGGPGGADQAIIQSTGKTLEDIFTVVYWDQRGAGASYSDTAPLSLAQLVDDGIVLSNLLLAEFDQDKLYLQGHSWGTLLGVHLVSEAPELFVAYFGIGQFANALWSEKLSWEFALAQAVDANDEASELALRELGAPPYATDQEWIDNVMQQRALMIPYEHPNQPPLFTMLDNYRIFALYNGYSIKEKLKLMPAFEQSLSELWPTVVASDLAKTHPRLDVPVVIFQGVHDKHTVTEVAKHYFDVLDAPEKTYYPFENSAHWPHLNEFPLYRKRVLAAVEKYGASPKQ